MLEFLNVGVKVVDRYSWSACLIAGALLFVPQSWPALGADPHPIRYPAGVGKSRREKGAAHFERFPLSGDDYSDDSASDMQRTKTNVSVAECRAARHPRTFTNVPEQQATSS